MDYIPPEQIGLIIAAIVGLIGSTAAAIGIFVRWLFGYFARVQDEKLNAMRQERELEKIEAEAKQRQRDMEIQRQLDETQTGRETMRLLFSELSESRKEDKEIRTSYERRENAHIEAMQGIQNNTAATLGLLKEMADKLSKHQEGDEIMEIKQERIIAQNETTHSKMADMGSLLAEIALKLEGITVGRASDRKIIEEIHGQVLSMQQSLSHIEESAKAPPQAVATATQPATDVTKSTEETQTKEEKENPQ